MQESLLIILILIYFSLNYKLFLSRNITELQLKIIITYVFIFGVLEFLGLNNFLRKFMIDFLIIILIFYQLTKKKFTFIYLKWFILFTFIYALSVILTYSDIYPSLTLYRIFLYPYIIFLAFFNLKISPDEWKKFNSFVASLFFLQIVASILKWLSVGVNEKVLIGTVTTSAGTYSTMIPLTAISILLAYYLLYQRNLKYFFLLAGFLFMGFAGAKRGIWLYLPIVLLIGLYFYPKTLNIIGFPKKILIEISLILAISISAVIVGAVFSPSLNPQGIKGGEFDADYLTDYAVEYTFNRSESEEVTLGRGANFLNITNQMVHSSPLVFLFGFGPESTKGHALYGEGVWSELGVAGPTPGLPIHWVSFGFLGVSIILFMIIKSMIFFFKLAKMEHDPYWKAFSFGGFLTCIVALIDYFTYSSSFLSTIFPLSFTLAYMLALGHYRRRFLKSEFLSQH